MKIKSKEVEKQQSERSGRRLTVCGGWETYFLLKKLEDRE
jgi:hypothetical protein